MERVSQTTVADNGNRSAAGIPPKKKRRWKAVNYMYLGIALIPIIAFAVFNGAPVILSFVSMFTQMQYNDLSTMEWNAFANFSEVFADPKFWKAWGNTLILGTAPFVTLLIALVIAALLEQKIKGSKILQVIYFIPYICSSVAIAIMWKWVFDGECGILNTITGQKVEWLYNSKEPFRLQIAVYVTIVWQAPAYGIVMFKAALKNVNPAFYEAAQIDGANGFKQFWHITLPGIKSVTLFLLLASINQGLSLFDAVTVLAPVHWTGVAGPDNAGLTISYYIYLEGVSHENMPYASVMSWILFIVTFAIAFPVIRARNKAAEE